MRKPDYRKVWKQYHRLLGLRASPERTARLELMLAAYPMLLTTRGESKPGRTSSPDAIAQRKARQDLLGST